MSTLLPVLVNGLRQPVHLKLPTTAPFKPEGDFYASKIKYAETHDGLRIKTNLAHDLHYDRVIFTDLYTSAHIPQKFEMAPNHTPELGVAGFTFLTNHLNQILLIQKRASGIWYLPGGICHQYEKIHQAAEREMQEETGLDIKGQLDDQPLFAYESIVMKPQSDEVNKAVHHNLMFFFRHKFEGSNKLQIGDEKEISDVQWIGISEFLESGMKTLPTLPFFLKKFFYKS